MQIKSICTHRMLRLWAGYAVRRSYGNLDSWGRHDSPRRSSPCGSADVGVGKRCPSGFVQRAILIIACLLNHTHTAVPNSILRNFGNPQQVSQQAFLQTSKPDMPCTMLIVSMNSFFMPVILTGDGHQATTHAQTSLKTAAARSAEPLLGLTASNILAFCQCSNTDCDNLAQASTVQLPYEHARSCGGLGWLSYPTLESPLVAAACPPEQLKHTFINLHSSRHCSFRHDAGHIDAQSSGHGAHQ